MAIFPHLGGTIPTLNWSARFPMLILSEGLPHLWDSAVPGEGAKGVSAEELGAPTAAPPAPARALCLLWLIASFLSAGRDMPSSWSQVWPPEGF